MKNITLTVKHDGQPLVGTKVIIGDSFQKAFITDAQGKITKSVIDDFAISTNLYIKHENGEMGIHGFVFEAGENYTIEV